MLAAPEPGEVGRMAPAQRLLVTLVVGATGGLADPSREQQAVRTRDEEQPARVPFPGLNATGQRLLSTSAPGPSRRQAGEAGSLALSHDHAHGDVPSVRAWASTAARMSAQRACM